MRLDKEKKEKKKANIKVIATTVVAITLIGIVGISIGRVMDFESINLGAVSDNITLVNENINKGFSFLKENFIELMNFKKNANVASNLKDENEELRKEVIELNMKLDELESLENLKKSLNFIDENYKATSIASRVVGKNDGNWYDTFVIGVGSDAGVQKESVVMNGEGLVGIIYEVSKNYSKAISLLDTKSSVSFKLLKDSDFKGVITQNTTISDKENYKNQGLLQGYMFDSSYNVLPGDVVVTSGLGLYPEGIPIGEIDKVIDDKNKSLKYVVVKPYADFKNIGDVLVIEPRKEEGIIE